MIPVDRTVLSNLNDLLGRELGRTPYGDPTFTWKWGPDLFWPAHATGRNIAVIRTVKIPILGGGTEETDIQEVTPEYRRERQCREDKWVIAKWLGPEELILGGSQGLGRGYENGSKPSHERLAAAWKSRFPGADFPSRGWTVATNASLPRGPECDQRPNLADTECFIACVKAQTAPTSQDHVHGIEAAMDKEDDRTTKFVGEEAREMWPAFLNINPGARGGDISMPFTKFDRSR